jgi:hypothetical protein
MSKLATIRIDRQVDKPVTIRPDGELQCPHCLGVNLHQTETTHYNRIKEDDERIQVTEVSDDGTTTTMNIHEDATSNPSGRRHGMRIEFMCETCEERPIELLIWQHKGTTYMSWETKK